MEGIKHFKRKTGKETCEIRLITWATKADIAALIACSASGQILTSGKQLKPKEQKKTR